MTPQRPILLLLRQPPYGTDHALEAVDVALVAAAFDQPVSVLFTGQGIWQLLADQDGSALDTRTQGKVLSALPHYDITDIYICAESLTRAGLQVEDLVLPAKLLTRAEQRELIAAHPLVVND